MAKLGAAPAVLRDHFWPWLEAVLEHLNCEVGEVFELSPDRRLFPRIRVPLGEDLRIGRERIDHVDVMLHVDRESVVADLLGHRPGSFIVTDRKDFPAAWAAAGEREIRDILWYVLLDSVGLLSWRVEWNVEWHVRLEGNGGPVPGCAAEFRSCSEPLVIHFPAVRR